ncbi:ribosome maturation factor RimP [Novispirillum sp. DQ9]|uniref:ribosome maturation factor RimP n=1 Tax=Novispirillum sp. DQ9 TaxID=3398612 RepID=UPI003C7AD87A
MQLQERLAAIIEPTLEGLGYELVRVMVQGTKRQTLQVMADRVDGAPMTVEDCSTISHALSAVLDVEDPIPGAYNLEVSSPGIDRPLTRAKDFVAWAGFEAKVETDSLVAGRKRFSGRLLGLDEAGEAVRLVAEDGEHGIPLARVAKAKLVLTDELIEAVTKRFEQEH